jgi:hypothetical protein
MKTFLHLFFVLVTVCPAFAAKDVTVVDFDGGAPNVSHQHFRDAADEKDFTSRLNRKALVIGPSRTSRGMYSFYTVDKQGRRKLVSLTVITGPDGKDVTRSPRPGDKIRAVDSISKAGMEKLDYSGLASYAMFHWGIVGFLSVIALILVLLFLLGCAMYALTITATAAAGALATGGAVVLGFAGVMTVLTGAGDVQIRVKRMQSQMESFVTPLLKAQEAIAGSDEVIIPCRSTFVPGLRIKCEHYEGLARIILLEGGQRR